MSNLFHPAYAGAIARAICYDLLKAGAVERIKIVGGLRRGDSKVRGISILYVGKTKLEYQKGSQALLFESNQETIPPKTIHLVDGAIKALGYLDHRLEENGQRVTPSSHPLAVKSLIDTKTKVPVDLYPATAQWWGAMLIEKTGPTAFVKKMQADAWQNGIKFFYGKIEYKDSSIAIPDKTEKEVFEICQEQWIEPRERR